MSAMPTVTSRTDVIAEQLLFSSKRIRPAPSRGFRLRMSTNEYQKKSDNWTVRCPKSSSIFIFMQSLISYLIKKGAYNI